CRNRLVALHVHDELALYARVHDRVRAGRADLSYISNSARHAREFSERSSNAGIGSRVAKEISGMVGESRLVFVGVGKTETTGRRRRLAVGIVAGGQEQDVARSFLCRSSSDRIARGLVRQLRSRTAIDLRPPANL